MSCSDNRIEDQLDVTDQYHASNCKRNSKFITHYASLQLLTTTINTKFREKSTIACTKFAIFLKKILVVHPSATVFLSLIFVTAGLIPTLRAFNSIPNSNLNDQLFTLRFFWNESTLKFQVAQFAVIGATTGFLNSQSFSVVYTLTLPSRIEQ